MYINIKYKKLSTHKNQCNLKSQNEKKKFETNCRFDVFEKCTTHFSLLMGHFLGQPNESSPCLERFAAQQAGQSDLIGKSQKNWAVAVDPAVSLSTYSTLPMEVGR